jgi:hypothetical protein
MIPHRPHAAVEHLPVEFAVLLPLVAVARSSSMWVARL